MSAALDFSGNEITTDGSIGQDRRLTVLINHDMSKDELSSRLNFDDTKYDKYDSAFPSSPPYFSDSGESWVEYQISDFGEIYSDVFMGGNTKFRRISRGDRTYANFYGKEMSKESGEDPQAVSDNIINSSRQARHMRLVKIFWFGAFTFILGIFAVSIGFVLSIHGLFKFSFLIMLVGSGLAVLSLFSAQESSSGDFT